MLIEGLHSEISVPYQPNPIQSLIVFHHVTARIYYTKAFERFGYRDSSQVPILGFLKQNNFEFIGYHYDRWPGMDRHQKVRCRKKNGCLPKVHSEAPQGLWLRQSWFGGSYPRGGQNCHQIHVRIDQGLLLTTN